MLTIILILILIPMMPFILAAAFIGFLATLQFFGY
jgi:type III secretory pathway component EscS